MRISIVLMILGILQASAMDLYSQQTKLSLEFTDTELIKVLDFIENESEYHFVYNEKLLDTNRKVSINEEEQSVEAILHDLFTGTDTRYTIIDHKIILAPASVAEESDQSDTQVKKKVTGKVTDGTTGEAMVGVNVVVKGTTIGTMTDVDGSFTLPNVNADATIIFSFIGYLTQERSLNGETTINVTLLEDIARLEEVVVVGYGTQKKVNLSGAVSTISSKELNVRPVATAAAALLGADPSINLTFKTGSLDADYNVNIRGVTSVNNGTPLILADGMEVSLNQISPNDIESISVLKDASAAAIYGAKASSGVILITTKKGRDMDGKAQIAFNSRYGISQSTTSTDFIHNGYDHVSIINKFYKSQNGTNMMLYDDSAMQMLLDRRNDKTENPERPWVVTGADGKYYYYGNFNWYDYFYRKTRPQYEDNLSITGGNDKLNYYVSARYLKQYGIFNIYDDHYDNYSFRAKINAKLTPWLRYSNNLSYNPTSYKYAGYYNEQQTIHNLQSNISSSFVPFNPDGSIVQYTNQLSANSPIGAGHGGFLTANTSRNTRSNNYLVISNQFDIDVTKDFVLTASYAFKNQSIFNKYRNMPFNYSKQEGVLVSFTSGTVYNYYQENHNDLNDHNVNIFGTYNHKWDKHNVTFVGGGQYEDNRVTSLGVQQRDLLSDDLSTFSVATGQITLTQSISAFRTLGFFGRLNYDFDGKYLFEASGRFDGTSRFESDSRWGFFPSASAAWRVSQEDFWKPLEDYVNNFKIRFSYGSLGNQQVDNYSYFNMISTNNTMSYTFDGTAIANYASISDPISESLTWETVTTYNGGMDFSFLKNRLSLSTDFFIRDTKDMLTTSLTLPSVYGANTPTENCADLRTKGWEISIGWNDEFTLMNKPFKYSVTGNIGDYETEITKYNNPNKLISDYYEGMQLGEIWGYKVSGLFASDQAAADYQARINDNAVNSRVYSSKTENYLRAGDVEFRDLNGDNSITSGSGTVKDPGDRRIIGNSQPRYSYSFRLSGNWNNIDVSAFFQGIGKQDWYPTAYAYYFWGPYSFPSLSFIHKDFLSDCWSEENPNGYFPRQRGYASYSGGALGTVNDRYLQKVSYLRLKNLSIGYTLPLLKKQVEKIRIYATGENLFYWSNLKKHNKTVDPELTNTASTYNSGSGVGYGYSKSYSFGIDILF